jgi:hypothetical protein
MIPPETNSAALSPSTRSDSLALDSWPAFALICLVAIAPLLVVGLPPLVDLYGHVGRYAVQTELAVRPELQPYFSYEWKLIGNLGTDLLVQALHPLLGLEGSVRAAIMITQLLGATGIMLVAREMHGRITPFAIAAIPLLFGYPFNYGFINYALSMALAMLAFVVWLRLHRSERAWQARLWLAVAGAGIWVCHTYGWAFLGLLCGSAMLAEVIAAKAPPAAFVRRILAACWPLLLPVAPMIVWRAESSGAAMAGWSLGYKLNYLLSALRTRWIELDLASLFVVYGLLIWAAFSQSARFDRRLGIAALLCFAFVLILPNYVFGSAFADMRLVPYALAIALMAIAPDRLSGKTLRVVSVIAFAFFAGRSVTTAAAYIDQDQRIAEVVPALDAIPIGARVAFFVVKPCGVRWALPVLDHVGGLVMARRSAFVNDQWQQAGVNSLIVHYPAAGRYAHDPSHLVWPDRCNHKYRPGIARALNDLPRGAFTHVWIVGELAGIKPPPTGFVLVPNAGKGLLYAIMPEA